MTPQFSRAVDPIFLYVLNLLDRISKEEQLNVQEERLKIRSRLEEAVAIVGQGPEWDLAKYALVSWIDEVLLEAPWDGRDWWNNNVLEVELFNTRLCNEQFYVKSKEASLLPKRDALEVFYVCVVLGFRGFYRDPALATIVAQSHGFPPDLEAWAKQTSLAIRLGQGRPPINQTGSGGTGAPPLGGQAMLVWASLVGVVLAAFTAMYALLFMPSK